MVLAEQALSAADRLWRMETSLPELITEKARTCLNDHRCFHGHPGQEQALQEQASSCYRSYSCRPCWHLFLMAEIHHHGPEGVGGSPPHPWISNWFRWRTHTL